MNTLHLKFIFSLAVLCCSLFVYSQQDATAPDVEELPYKPIAEFNNDTIAFVEHNFIKRPAKSYAGMTVGEIEKLINLPESVMRLDVYPDSDKKHCYLCIFLRDKDEKGRGWVDIILSLETPLTDLEYNIIRKRGEKYEVLGDRKISGAKAFKNDLDMIKSNRENRKPRKPHPMTDVINKDTEEVKKKLKEKKTE